MSRKSSIGAWIVAVMIVAGIIAGAWWVRQGKRPMAPPPAATTAPSTAASQAIAHPISQAAGPAAASTAPLPPLEASDARVADALAALAGGGSLQDLLVDTHIIERIVATIDALPRRELGRNVLPLQPPGGSFAATTTNGETVLAADNYPRYAAYMQWVRDSDPKAVVDWYVRHYPLFQQAYRQLGYPDGYFNDRLVKVIDHLLAAPEPDAPLRLVRTDKGYEFADPQLQSLSVGQKMLLRVGPANEAVIKAKLRAIRAGVTGRQLPAASTSAAAGTPELPASSGSAG